MSDIKGFQKYKRETPLLEDPKTRINHFREFYKPHSQKHTKLQSERCMECGVPFCHNGCPLGNMIPDFNEAVAENRWKDAYKTLDSTNNFPEFTGRICPAPCEGACVLGINSDPVSIEYIEKTIIEKAFASGWVKPKLKSKSTGKTVAIIGSGPSGLACAEELNKAGHKITVYEKSDRVGGLLRYGIPDFKLEKSIIDRRIKLLLSAGIEFKTNVNVGIDISPQKLLNTHDAIVLCGGSSVPRDLNIDGREFKGIHFAMDYLTSVNKKVAGDDIPVINPKGKNVLVIGGGDTGSDCIGSLNRSAASSIIQIELLGKPPIERTIDNPWPLWPMILRKSTSQEEGCERSWNILTKKFLTADGENISGVEIVKVEWKKNEDNSYSMHEIPSSTEIIPCDIVFLAMGFTHPLLEGSMRDLMLKLDRRKNIKAENHQTSVAKIFAAGDMRQGQSLVVWAISEGRKCATAVDEFLSNEPINIDLENRNIYSL